MSQKALLPNQCEILHPVTGAENCCLCKARDELAALRAENEKLRNAIARHRHDMWGDGQIEHHVDEELYNTAKGD